MNDTTTQETALPFAQGEIESPANALESARRELAAATCQTCAGTGHVPAFSYCPACQGDGVARGWVPRRWKREPGTEARYWPAQELQMVRDEVRELEREELLRLRRGPVADEISASDNSKPADATRSRVGEVQVPACAGEPAQKLLRLGK